MKHISILVAVLLLSATATVLSQETAAAPSEEQAQEQEQQSKTKLDVALVIAGFTLSGEDLANSGYKWADKEWLKNVPIIPLAAPALNMSWHPATEKPFMWSLDGTLTPVGLGVGGKLSYTLLHLLTFAIQSDIGSGWNYGNSLVSWAVYDPRERDYDGDTAFTTALYNVGGSVTGVVPLPKNNIIQLSYNAMYSGYTGADNGEPWKAGMIGEAVNGWHFATSAMLAHMFKNTQYIKMIAISGSAAGWYDADDFDPIYQDFNPGYVTLGISPMIQMSLNERQSLVVVASILRERDFVNDDFKSRERLLQDYDGSTWRFKTVSCIWNIKLK